MQEGVLGKESRGTEPIHARTIPLTFIVPKEMLESLGTSFPHANTHIADPWLFLFSEPQVQVTGNKERWGLRTQGWECPSIDSDLESTDSVGSKYLGAHNVFVHREKGGADTWSPS